MARVAQACPPYLFFRRQHQEIVAGNAGARVDADGDELFERLGHGDGWRGDVGLRFAQLPGNFLRLGQQELTR